jgi:protein-disulfide isomerase
VTQIVEKYKDKIAFQYRHLPLTQVHPNALAAARASEAASEQGKFWEMYDQLFLNQATWSQSNSATKYFEQYATQAGLDLARYKTDAAAPKSNKLVNADMAAFKKTGDTVSTPTFYLNSKKLDLKTLLDAEGRPSIEKFSQVIDAKLKETSQQ